VLLASQVQREAVENPQQALFHGPWPRDGERLVAVKPLHEGEWLTAPAVRRERLVLEASAPLAAGLRLPHEQLAARWKPVLGLPGDTLAPEALPDFVALARPLRAGAVLRQSDLKSAILVPKGSTVTVQIRRGEFVLDAELIAEEDGALGERISVHNPESGRRLSAVVSGPGQAVHD
jgi:flagella basal body P-ring formation protein FlgA